VWRAGDTRPGRDAAFMVPPAEFAPDAERLRRLQWEELAVAARSHTDILARYDVRMHEGVPSLVTELLGGESLRKRLGYSALPVRRDGCRYVSCAVRGGGAE
jgi:eukaryotic-like serine/threonine-protein kinase